MAGNGDYIAPHFVLNKRENSEGILDYGAPKSTYILCLPAEIISTGKGGEKAILFVATGRVYGQNLLQDILNLSHLIMN